MSWYVSLQSKALAALACLWLVMPAANAEPKQPLQVLILNSYDDSTEPYAAATESFQQQMEREYSTPISFRDINLEERHSDGDSRERLMEELLAELHSQRPPDLVAAVGPPAVSFWLRHRDELFPHVPFVAGAGEGRFFRSDLRPGDFGVVTRLFFPDFVDDFLLLRPDTRHILALFGATPYERRLAAFMQSQFDNLDASIQFEYTNDLTLAELLIRTGELEEGSAIFYGLFISDPEGIAVQRGSALPMIRQASRVPVFGALENQMGRGIVGGRLLQLKSIGTEMALAAQALLTGPTEQPGWTAIALSDPVYDWRELQSFGIDATVLPHGSTLLFKPDSVWSRYLGWIVLLAAVMLIQGLLITALLFERWRRRRAELGQATLSGKLISAHEDERRRIARELHDDLSQRLARLSIDAGALAGRETASAASAQLQQLHNDLVDISKDCHDISYRLHPSLLEDLGLVTALQSEIQSVRKQTTAALVEDIAELPVDPSRDASLCTYRIVQAALSNAVKHANARTIEIALQQQGDWITARVRDDGKGFLFDEDDYDIGLGISSMRERARLVGAQFKLHSALGQGTTVTVKTAVQGQSS